MAEEVILPSPVLLLLRNLLHVFLVFFVHKGCSWIKLLAQSLKATMAARIYLSKLSITFDPLELGVKQKTKNYIFYAWLGTSVACGCLSEKTDY
jgi:hypothetical protein